MGSSIDITKPTSGTATTQSVRDNFSYAKTEIEALQLLTVPTYLCLSSHSSLVNERILIATIPLTLTDSGAGGNYTLALNIALPLSISEGKLTIGESALTENLLDIYNAPSDGYFLKWSASHNKLEYASTSVSTHNLLSATHSDTVTASPIAGDIIYANSNPAWTKLAKGSDGQVLTLASGLPAWAATPAGLWIDTGTYIRPGNVTDSGNTAVRIYDTGYMTLGNTTTDDQLSVSALSSINGDILRIASGTLGSPSASANPAIWVQRWDNRSTTIDDWYCPLAYFEYTHNSGIGTPLPFTISTNWKGGSVRIASSLHLELYNEGLTLGTNYVHNLFTITRIKSGINSSAMHNGIMVAMVNEQGAQGYRSLADAGVNGKFWTCGIHSDAIASVENGGRPTYLMDAAFASDGSLEYGWRFGYYCGRYLTAGIYFDNGTVGVAPANLTAKYDILSSFDLVMASKNSTIVYVNEAESGSGSFVISQGNPATSHHIDRFIVMGTGEIAMWLGGSLKLLSVDGLGFVKAT